VIRTALLLVVAVLGLPAAAMIPGNEIVTFPPELPDAGGVAVVVRYGQRPGEVVLRFEPSPGRPMVMAIPEDGRSGGVSGPVVQAPDQPLRLNAVRYQPAEAIDPRAGTTDPVTAILELSAPGPLDGLLNCTLIVSYTIPAERLVVRRQLALPLPAAWVPP